MEKDNFENEVITKTVMPSGLLTGMTVGTLQEDFPLCEADFLRLKMNQSFTKTWAVNFLFAAIGFGLSIAPKFINELSGKTNQISKAEWITLFAGFAVSAILYVLDFCLPNERKSAMKIIEQHFKNAPKSRQIIQGKK